MFSVTKVLEAHGHNVIPFSIRHSRNVDTPYAEYFADNIGGADDLFFEQMDSSLTTRMQLLDRQFYSFHVRERLERLIEATSPDVAYVLHHQNRLSPSVMAACKRKGIPIVMRISDFALVCTRGSLLRDGRICELCITDGLWNGVQHRCVKGSFLASAIKATALSFYRLSGLYGCVARFVIPSRFTMQKLSCLLDPEKMTYLPTLAVPQREYDPELGRYALFVGRVEEEKGLIHAIKAFEGTDFPLKVVGYSHSGYGRELIEYVRTKRIKNVEFLGPRYGDDLEEIYKRCRFVVLPVIWYENLPNVALEAMAHGKPVVASNIGSMREVVSHEENGFLFEPADVDGCRGIVERLFTDDALTKTLGAQARHRVAEYYSPERHYQNLMALFETVVTGHVSPPS